MSTLASLQHATARPKPRRPAPHASVLLQRQCACGASTTSLTGKCSHCQARKFVQTHLSIGASNDPLEKEADRVADTVLAKPSHAAISTALPRIQRASASMGTPSAEAPASVDRVLANPGRPLERGLQQDMTRRFGHDFSGVRVHDDPAAAHSAREVDANAYTVGHDIVFDANRFAPGTPAGRRLLAHELTHVVQQGGSASGHLQREASSMPCGPVDFDSLWPHLAIIDGGPYADQGIVIPYDELAPKSDPMADFDRAESIKTFKDPARLEQVYHDASLPEWKFADRWRAAWWLCSVVEPVAREIGAQAARDVNSLGCLTIQNCGVNWVTVLGNFSESTASGLRNRALLLKGFTDTSFDIGLSLQIINSALMLYGGVAAARAGLSKSIPTTPAATRPVEAPKSVSPAEPVSTVSEPTSPTAQKPATPPAKRPIGFQPPNAIPPKTSPATEEPLSRPVAGFGRKIEPRPSRGTAPQEPQVDTQMPPASVRTSPPRAQPPAGQQRDPPVTSMAKKPPGSTKADGGTPKTGTVKSTVDPVVPPVNHEQLRQIDAWEKQGKLMGDTPGLRRKLRSGNAADREIGQTEFDNAREAIEGGQKWDVEEMGQTRRPMAQEDNRISTGNKTELENSEWLKKRIPDPEARRKFMDWLDKNHRTGETGTERQPGKETEKHDHYSPGSKAAEEAVKNWEREEGKRTN